MGFLLERKSGMGRSVTVGIILGLALAGCSTGPEVNPPPTQLELRSMQTRTYDTADTKLVMKAMINVLQDLGYVVKSADSDLGLLTAEKWTNIQQKKKTVKKAEKAGKTLARMRAFECTANVSKFGNECRVRVNFQCKILDDHGAILQVQTIEDAASYQRFHAGVDKGIFLQKEGV